MTAPFASRAFTASDVVEMYLHRGAFEPTLSDEDQELDPDRWCSHSAWGQECWQIISQWVPEPETGTGASVRANASAHGLSFAPAISTPQAACHLNSLTHSHFCLWIWSTRHGYPPRKAGRFTGADFPLQPDGTLQCKACHALHRKERRRAR